MIGDSKKTRDELIGELDALRKHVAAFKDTFASPAVDIDQRHSAENAFHQSARRIFDLCRDLTGARAGYVALLNEHGDENEVLFLEAGGLPCNVDPELPMPVRGLRAEAYRTGRVVFGNDFTNSHWTEFLPPGHVRLENVLFVKGPKSEIIPTMMIIAQH